MLHIRRSRMSLFLLLLLLLQTCWLHNDKVKVRVYFTVVVIPT